jgi:dienelactone hydrolase
MRQMSSPTLTAVAIALALLGTESLHGKAAAPRGLGQSEGTARFEIAQSDLLIDDRLPIVVSGLPPNATVTIRLRGGAKDEWTSNATFVADAGGKIDLARVAPVRGVYKDADPMGLFWSVERSTTGRPNPSDAAEEDDGPATPDSWTLGAEINGTTIARANLRRRAVSSDVRVTPIQTNGIIGTFYEPPGQGRHPAVLVLGGSNGGIPPAGGPAGGLASRGYAVLALAYFGVKGLPSTLSNIPIEYFGNALDWLASQPSVDPDRIGVLGSSRGAELALLLGVTFQHLRTVVAYMPSNVVWGGCCDASTVYAWTVHGRPVASMPRPGRRTLLDAQRAEIPVERIHGGVLLISGRDDGVWPSAEMASKIVARLRQNDFKFPFESLVYEHTGHGITRPYTTTMELNSRRHPLSGRVVHMGGTPSGTAKAREESWPHVLEFIDRNVKGAPTSSFAHAGVEDLSRLLTPFTASRSTFGER